MKVQIVGYQDIDIANENGNIKGTRFFYTVPQHEDSYIIGESVGSCFAGEKMVKRNGQVNLGDTVSLDYEPGRDGKAKLVDYTIL